MEEQFDLVCVGFGPASLAIAIALYDRGVQARVLYVERQHAFVWHAGMLLPNARMQISFLKDIATLRDPRSRFTFINYLKIKNRLVVFINLSTFLPLREEYNDYMSWCASHFESDVRYGQECVQIFPIKDPRGIVHSWRLLSEDVMTKGRTTITAKHVVIAVGGKPRIPSGLTNDDRIIHSSTYSNALPQSITDAQKKYNIAVIGGGQSAAEIFNDLQSRYPDSHVTLYTGASALKPSDDSPLYVYPTITVLPSLRLTRAYYSVNEIFDPERVDTFYSLSRESRQKNIQSDKATTYGVVRAELLGRMYENMYHQRLREPDQSKWQFKIVAWEEAVGYEKQSDNRLMLRFRNTANGELSMSESGFDLVIVATGYQRNVHETLLEPARDLLLSNQYAVDRNYRLKFRDNSVKDGCGIWLQGCCEDSHGVRIQRLYRLKRDPS